MARTLERPNLYEQDYLAWLEEQIAHLRAGRLERLDVAHLIEELEGMAASDRRQLRRRLEVLLTHVLKRDHRPGRSSRSWHATIAERRRRLRELLEESPSLKHHLNEAVIRAYEGAVEQAAIEAGAREDAFPPSLPYTIEQILERPPKEGER